MKTIKGVVAAKEPLTDRITEFKISPTPGNSLPEFEPGSHATFVLPDDRTRSYSLVTFDGDGSGDYRFAVQVEEAGDGGSKAMHALGVGHEVTFEPPKNDFELVLDRPAVLLAGGIGVTPLISMATALKAAGTPFRFHFAGRTGSAMVYRERLQEALGDALVLHCDDEPDTVLDLDAVVAEATDKDLYVCGPRGMIEAAKSKAEAAGMPKERIHFELFDNVGKTQEGDSAFEVELASSGEVFTVGPGQSIIDVLEAGGVDVLYDCRRGDCGICQCDVVSGTPDHRDVVLSDEERDSGKVMQICVSRAKSPRLVLDL